MSVSMIPINSGTYYGDGYSSGYGSGYTRQITSYDMQRTSKYAASNYDYDLSEFANYLKEGKTTQALEIYDETIEAMREYSNVNNRTFDESQVRSLFDSACEQAIGYDLSTAVAKYTDSSFTTGLKEGIPIIGWVFEDGTSNEEARAQIRGDESVSLKESAKELLGSATSSAITCAIPGIGFMIKGALTGSAVGPAGAIIGGVVGAVAGVVAFLAKKAAS